MPPRTRRTQSGRFWPLLLRIELLCLSVSCKIFLVVTAPPRRSRADDSGAFFCPPFRPQTTPFPPQPLALLTPAQAE